MIYPVRSVAVIEAIRYCKGLAIEVSEQEVVAAHQTLSARGLFVEPTSASIAAALLRVPNDVIKPRETVVGILTGHGLKNPPKLATM